MAKHNNAIAKPQNHMKKEWFHLVKTWYNQAGRKNRRLNKRIEKARTTFPNPIKRLRPVVHKPTARYSGQERYGKGFTLEELKMAGISARFAQTIGISVDFRRGNNNLDALKKNADRLKQYKEKLVLLPKVTGKPKKGVAGKLSDSTEEKPDLIQNNNKNVISNVSQRLREKPVKITKEMNKTSVYGTLRTERMNKRHAGKRAKKLEDEKKKD